MEISKILKKKLEDVKVPDEDIEKLKEEAKKQILEIERELKKRKIKAEVFLGGSLAKETIIKRDRYDIDIFVRFDEKYKDEEISNLLEKVILGKRIHGSRDYFQIEKSKLLFEIIPVIKVSSPEKARNITDLSYFHVSYVLDKIKKNKKLKDEIILAKAFCYSRKCYGAESYIRGFSGYALELIICHFGSFLNFVKEASKKNKIIIDDAKFYKNKGEILNNLNEAKLSSPVIIIDPTFKGRNALAALSLETWNRFREDCRKFLKNPSEKFFEMEKINEKDFNLIIEISSFMQAGDIAGSKMLKFFGFLSREIERSFIIKKKDFEYNKNGKCYFKIEKKKEIIVRGPPIIKAENFLDFKNKHKKIFVKNKTAYAKENTESLSEIISKARKNMKEMGISEMRIIKE